MAIETDVLVIGCGIAGAAAALELSRDRTRDVLVITREHEASETATAYAQGGIATVGPADDPSVFAEDIIAAGAQMSLPAAAERLAASARNVIERVLIDEAGVQFTRSVDGGLSYAREGAHRSDRVLHADDATGKAIQRALLARISNRSNVRIEAGWTAVDLISTPHHSVNPLAVYQPNRCRGAYALDRNSGEVHRILAPITVLATGGHGQIFRHTSNPPGARGDGLAMAYRAGVNIVNAEYMQFHPTTLAVPGAGNFLISEAVRGAGAVLVSRSGDRFMERVSPEWKELAPRDVVSRAIHRVMLEHDDPYVLLDLATVLDPEAIATRFPMIHARCLSVGVDLAREPIPVVPAAHYACGGVLVDDVGRTILPGLYAIGEVSCTGVHGANRLASTSLLEGLVWGTAAGEDIRGRTDLIEPAAAEIPEWAHAPEDVVADPILVHRDVETLQNIMWHYVGLLRTGERLDRAVEDLNHLWRQVGTFYRETHLDDRLIGLRNMVQCAWITARAARRNRVSHGTHYREDSAECS